MSVELIKKELKSSEYRKFKKNMRHSICIEGITGPYAYGIPCSSSDLEIRGCYMPTPNEILSTETLNAIESVEYNALFYPVAVFCALLEDGNPYLVELLGLPPENYLKINKAGHFILENRHVFLSKKYFSTIRGYISSDLKRIKRHHAISKTSADTIKQVLIKKTSAIKEDPCYNIELDIDKKGSVSISGVITSGKPEILLPYIEALKTGESSLKKYLSPKPLAEKILCKKMANVIRLSYMLCDLLRDGEISTVSKSGSPDVLKAINGEFLDNEKNPSDEFYELVGMLSDRAEIFNAKNNLPKVANHNMILNIVETLHSMTKIKKRRI